MYVWGPQATVDANGHVTLYVDVTSNVPIGQRRVIAGDRKSNMMSNSVTITVTDLVPDVGLLMMYQKNPSDWSIIQGGAWGWLVYALQGPTFWFTFQGYGLDKEQKYDLLYYVDPWPGQGSICLTKNLRPNGNGRVSTSEFIQTYSALPTAYDWNNPMNPNHNKPDPSNGQVSTINGAKIWLVLAKDVDCGKWQYGPDHKGVPISTAHMSTWNPAKYLFEGRDTPNHKHDGIFFDNTQYTSLFLWQKDVTANWGGTWNIIQPGAWAWLTFKNSGKTFDYVTQGYGLLSHSASYSVVYYADPWPGNHPGASLGSATTDAAGNVGPFWGSVPLGFNLPTAPDTNPGAKLWYALTADYDGHGIIGNGNAPQYLFENNGITYMYTP